jgi:hypothetical protein
MKTRVYHKPLKRRKTLKKRGGGSNEVDLLKRLKPKLLAVFENHKNIEDYLHKKTEVITVPYYPSFFLHIHLKFEEKYIKEIEIEISQVSNPKYISRGHPKYRSRDLGLKGCWLGSERYAPEDKEMPWGEYVHPTVVAKGITIKGDYNFSLTCESYQGSKFTNVMFIIYFYILKLHSNYIGVDDYIITADDTAKVGDKFVYEYAIEKVQASGMTLDEIMRTPLMYYERFGFYYPEKEEYFSNLLKTGRAYIDFYNSKGEVSEDDMLTRYYLELKNVPIQKLYDMAQALAVKVPYP